MESSLPVAMTTKNVEAMIGQLDRIIGKAEARIGELDERTMRALMALQQQRSKLRLLAIARRIERQKSVVSLERWRYGFDAPRSTATPEQEVSPAEAGAAVTRSAEAPLLSLVRG
jgi:hypothetical protein